MAREQALWAALYPSDLAQVFPAWAQLATGLRKPVEQTLGVKTLVPTTNVVAVLRADPEVLREVATQDQAAALRGVSAAKLIGREAQWKGKTDFVGPRFAATSPEQAVKAEREKNYTDQLRKRIRGDSG